MNHYRWLGVALSVGLLTGCPAGLGLNPQTFEQLNAFLGEYGLNLKTVDPSTGEARTYAESDIQSVVGEDGKPIDYKFDGGRMVFRPTKEGAQRITVTFKDGTTQQFTVEGKKSDSRMNGDVAFIPDGSGQGFNTEVGIGREIDVEARHGDFLAQMAAKRVALTFAGAPLQGLTPESLRAVYFDRMKLPPFTYAVDNGVLKLDPNHFFMAREYQRHTGSYPMIRVITENGGQLQVMLAVMSELPELPDFTPPQPGAVPPPPPGPDAFKSGQVLDLGIKAVESLTMTLEQYEQDRGLQTNVPRPGELPPPPSTEDRDALRAKIEAHAVTFTIPALAGVNRTDIRAIFVGKMPRPLAPTAPDQPPVPIDLLDISSDGSIKLDSMLIGHAFQLWYGPLNANTSDMPWIRVFSVKDGTRKVTAFRFPASGSDWFTSPTATGWILPTRPGDADDRWIPPQPPFGSFGLNQVVSNPETFTYTFTGGDLHAFKTLLEGYDGHNPADDDNRPK
jgi:hypothetical protein